MSRFRPGRLLAPEGVLTEAEAAARMLALIRAHHEEQTLLERDAAERRRRGVTVRELASEYLHWLEDVKGAKPSTLRDHRSLLAEPGQAYRRRNGASRGLIMAALGDRPAREVTTHRDPSRPAVSSVEIVARAHENAQDAELIRVAAYAGLRRGELVALRWRDVDFVGRKIVIRRSLSGETDSGLRKVPERARFRFPIRPRPR